MFHEEEIPNLPPCVENKMGLARRRVICYDSNDPNLRSPVRVMKQTRSNLPSPTKLSANARIIGDKLLVRAAGETDRLLVATPKVTESPLKSLRQMRKSVAPRRKPNPLAVWRPGSTHRTRVGARAMSAMAAVSRLRKRAGTEAMSAMATVSCLRKREGTEGHRKKATNRQKGHMV